MYPFWARRWGDGEGGGVKKKCNLSGEKQNKKVSLPLIWHNIIELVQKHLRITVQRSGHPLYLIIPWRQYAYMQRVSRLVLHATQNKGYSAL